MASFVSGLYRKNLSVAALPVQRDSIGVGEERLLSSFDGVVDYDIYRLGRRRLALSLLRPLSLLRYMLGVRRQEYFGSPRPERGCLAGSLVAPTRMKSAGAPFRTNASHTGALIVGRVVIGRIRKPSCLQAPSEAVLKDGVHLAYFIYEQDAACCLGHEPETGLRHSDIGGSRLIW